MKTKNWGSKRTIGIGGELREMMKCIRSGEQVKEDDDLVHSSDSLATRDYSATASGYSSRTAEVGTKVDNCNIEEAESCLRESGYLNYEEARALLGRLEYQKGNTEGAIHVFEGIDIANVTLKIKVSISRRFEQNRCYSLSDAAPLMSMHAISLLLEAIYLKAKSFQHLGRYTEAAQSCKVILDTVESALPEGLPENFGSDCKLQETLVKAVEVLPEFWILSGFPHEAILSYRRSLLYNWNLDTEVVAKIEKEFAVFLLYSGYDASPPNLRLQLEGSFVPRNNLEEGILLLMILLKTFILGKIVWDPSIIDHLSYALSVSGELGALACQVEELLPGTMERREKFCTLALCYNGEGKNMDALNLLKNILNNRESKDCLLESLLASKICGETMTDIGKGIHYVCNAISMMDGKCSQLTSISNCLLGVLLSAKSRISTSDSERIMKQSEALEVLENAERTMNDKDPYIVFHLCLEYAQERNLDMAFYYAKQLLELEGGSNVRTYILLARILSAQKRFVDAESVINAALNQTGKWDQGELLRTKAKLQMAQGQLKNAIETYSHVLAVLQVRNKSLSAERRVLKSRTTFDRSLEMETWHDLANIYTSMSCWRDTEICLSKCLAINPHSASRWYCTGLVHEAKGLYQEALKAFRMALDIEPNHVQSLISTACVLRHLGGQTLPVVRSFLMDALRIDRTNPSAWYNLGLLYKADARASPIEAAECFEYAALLEESAPVEPPLSWSVYKMPQ